MKIVLLAATLLIPLAEAASLTGTLVDVTGAYVAKAEVTLDSGTTNYRSQTDGMGVFQFSNLPAGDYTLTIYRPGSFGLLTVKFLRVLKDEQKRIPDVTLMAGGCSGPFRDLQLLPREILYGTLRGSVVPPIAEVEVTLVCRTFSPCRSTKTDSKGHFSFEMLSAGVYGLNFRREGFYPEIAAGYDYTVNAGWEAVYNPKVLESCPNGNCDPKLRPPRPIIVCE